MKPRLGFTTFSSLLEHCSQSGAGASEGKILHSQIIKHGFQRNVYLATKLVTMYGMSRVNMVDDARRILDTFPKPNIFMWNALIRAYAWNDAAMEAIKLYHGMLQEPVSANNFTFPFVLKACASLATDLALRTGKKIHVHACKLGLRRDVYVGAALVDMYGKCRSIVEARQVFDEMPHRDVALWNSMAAAYLLNGFLKEALIVFQSMQSFGTRPSQSSLVTVLPICAEMATVRLGQEIHAYITRCGFGGCSNVGNSLIDMYAKCGKIVLARHVFDRIAGRDLVSWNAMICAYGMHGRGSEAVSVFEEMIREGIAPDHISFVGVLSACSHAGMEEDCWYFFNLMSSSRYNVGQGVEHYTCMVHVLGRKGHLNEAFALFKSMPVEPDSGILGALFFACCVHGNVELGEQIYPMLHELEPDSSGNYVLLSNLYAAKGQWCDVAHARRIMRARSIQKMAGCSWIEVKNRVHLFVAGDRSHPQSLQIYEMLAVLEKKMTSEGYIADTSPVMHDVDEDEKIAAVCSHSERLALAFGLLSTAPGTDIQIMKNLRICSDCHAAVKLISRIVGREIIVRDVNRFHQFRNGECSCKDYW